MATVYTKEYDPELFKPVDKDVDIAFDDRIDAAYKKLIAPHKSKIVDKVVEATDKVWIVKCTCLNCLRDNSTIHPDNTTLKSLISFYSTRVCGSCGYIDQIKFPNGRSSLNYIFYGTVRIYDKYGSLVHTINNMDLKTAQQQNSTSVDTNWDNVYVSIWDDPKKVRTKGLIEQATSRHNSDNYDDEDFDDDDYSADDNSPVI